MASKRGPGPGDSGRGDDIDGLSLCPPMRKASYQSLDSNDDSTSLVADSVTAEDNDAICIGQDSFPFKVYNMIAYCHKNDPETACFDPGEKGGFIVRNKNTMVEKYLMMHKVCLSRNNGGTPQFESFHHQLNTYGFSKFTKGKTIIYRHKDFLFRKGDRASLKQIKRKAHTKKSNSPGADETEPKCEILGLRQVMEKKFSDLEQKVASHCKEAGEENALKSEIIVMKNKVTELVRKVDFYHEEMMKILIENLTTGSNGYRQTSGKGSSSRSQFHFDTSLDDISIAATADCMSTGSLENEITNGYECSVSTNSFCKTDKPRQTRKEDEESPKAFQPTNEGNFDDFFGKEGADLRSAAMPPRYPTDTLNHSPAVAQQSNKKRKPSTTTRGTESCMLYSDSPNPEPNDNLEPNENDVLCGDGDFSQHIGNQRHKGLVLCHRKEYQSASEEKKRDIRDTIVIDIECNGGIFLKQAQGRDPKNVGETCWFEMSRKEALAFTARALEEAREGSAASDSSAEDKRDGKGPKGPGAGGKGGGDKDFGDKGHGHGHGHEGSGGSGGGNIGPDTDLWGICGVGSPKGSYAAAAAVPVSEKKDGSGETSQTREGTDATKAVGGHVRARNESRSEKKRLSGRVAAGMLRDFSFTYFEDANPPEKERGSHSVIATNERRHAKVLVRNTPCTSSDATESVNVDEHRLHRPERGITPESIPFRSQHRERPFEEDWTHVDSNELTTWPAVIEKQERERPTAESGERIGINEATARPAEAKRRLPFRRIGDAIQATERMLRQLNMDKDDDKATHERNPRGESRRHRHETSSASARGGGRRRGDATTSTGGSGVFVPVACKSQGTVDKAGGSHHSST